MTPLPLTFTRDGLAAFTAAQLGGDVDLTVAQVALTDQVFIGSPTLEALPGEIRRLDTIAGEVVGDNIIHLMIRDDDDTAAYGVRGLGLYLADGTLFAFYGQDTRIVEKSTLTALYLALDIAFPTGITAELRFGDTSFIDPPATTERRGVIEIATIAEALAGLDALRAITPASLKAVADALRGAIDADLIAFEDVVNAALLAMRGRTITGGGLVTGGGDLSANRVLSVAAATAAEIVAGTEAGKAITPAALGGLPKSLGTTGYVVHPSGLIEQWGRVRVPASTEVTASVTFPIAFTSTAFVVSLTGFISAPSILKDLWPQLAGEATLTGMTVQYQRAPNGDPGIDGFDWRMIGI